MATFSVSFSATGGNLVGAINSPANWGSVPAGMQDVSNTLKQALLLAAKALNVDGSQGHTDHNPSQLKSVSLTAAASVNTATHAVSVTIS